MQRLWGVRLIAWGLMAVAALGYIFGHALGSAILFFIGVVGEACAYILMVCEDKSEEKT